MSASYPDSIKAFTDIVDGSDYMEATQMNQAYDEIEAIETLIGAFGSTQSHNATLLSLLKDYRIGCRVEADTDAQITVAAGAVVCEDASGNKKLRRNTSSTTVTWADIDTGAEAASTRYYVHAVADTAATTFTVVISTSSTAPTGVTTFALLGSFYNNASSNITDVMDDLHLRYKEPGALQPWPTNTPPGGALLCDGSAQDASGDETLDDLYAVIGTTFGGSDETDFEVPDLRGRVVAGQDDMGGASADRVTDAQADSLAGVMGTETHTLTEAELPAHTHTINHAGASGTGLDNVNWASGENGAQHDTGSTGSGDAHQNMQPTMFLNWIIWK